MNDIDNDKTDLVDDEVVLRQKLSDSETELESLERGISDLDEELEALAQRNHDYEVLSKVCRSIEELDDIGAAHLFWGEQHGSPREQLDQAHRNIEEHGASIIRIEQKRLSLVDEIGDHNLSLDALHYELSEAVEREENRRAEWLVERDSDEIPAHAQIMAWSRGYEEDRRFRKSLASSLLVAAVMILLIGTVAIPIMDRQPMDQLPERVASLVRQNLPPPPPAPVEVPQIEEELTEPEPELAEADLPPEIVPEAADEPAVASVEPDTREQVKSKGILAFRESFADRASLRPSPELGSQARVRSAGENTVGRTQRAMVTTNASGSSGGINLADISRDVGGGGGEGMGGVEISRVASSIGSGGNADRPLAGGMSAGRTDEEIQIVFDRYKASLYRLYNRELRKNPTLRGQVVLQLTIEPDGTVSFCILQSSDMKAPALSQQVVDRVSAFDFGAKEDIVAVTIIYPIDFLPAA